MASDEFRTAIPALSDVTYLNTDTHGPSLHPIVERATKFLEYHEYEPPGDDRPYPTAFNAYEAVREDVAAFVGTGMEEVALTRSTTDGINRITTALDQEPGDVVVRTDLKHPAGILPWRRLGREGVEARVVESETGWLDVDQYAGVVSSADLVCFSSLTWNYGTWLPVYELTDVVRDAGTLSVVDAVQSFGQHPVAMDDWGAGIITSMGHRWLLGPWDAGFLYVRREVTEGIEPHVAGYRDVMELSADGPDFAPGARHFKVGTTSPAPHVALRETIDITERVGPDRTEEHVRNLAGRFTETAPEGRLLGPHDPESGLVPFEVPDPGGTVGRFKSAGAIVRMLSEPTAVRASFHSSNDEPDVAALCDGLDGEWWVQHSICRGGEHSYPPT